jgi:hypothetical protein
MRLIPSPAQYDHWQLYQTIMHEEMLARFGVAEYDLWAFSQQRGEKFRKNWVALQAKHDKFIRRAYLSRS